MLWEKRKCKLSVGGGTNCDLIDKWKMLKTTILLLSFLFKYNFLSLLLVCIPPSLYYLISLLLLLLNHSHHFLLLLLHPFITFSSVTFSFSHFFLLSLSPFISLPYHFLFSHNYFLSNHSSLFLLLLSLLHFLITTFSIPPITSSFHPSFSI